MQRRAYFRPLDIGMKGDEGTRFIQRYKALLSQWRKLKEERE